MLELCGDMEDRVQTSNINLNNSNKMTQLRDEERGRVRGRERERTGNHKKIYCTSKL